MAEFADPYMQRGTDVLRNKFGIQDGKVLRQLEYELTQDRGESLRSQPIAGKFDLAHLQAIHRHLFQDLYDWAGELRKVNLSKGGSSFTRNSQLEAEGARIAAGLEREGYLRGLPKPQFVERMTELYDELNRLHPFREGNGRATREFLGQLAREAGYELDQTRIDRVKAEWNQAARLAFQGEQGPMRDVFADALRPSRALAFDRLPQAEALAKFPELQASYARLEAAAAKIAQQHPHNAQAQRHFLAQARGEELRRLDSGQVPARQLSERPMPAAVPPTKPVQRGAANDGARSAEHAQLLKALERKARDEGLAPSLVAAIVQEARNVLARRERGPDLGVRSGGGSDATAQRKSPVQER